MKNLHVSGFDTVHGDLSSLEDKLDRFFDLFSDKDLPIIIEILPLEQARQAQNIITKVGENFKKNFYKKTLDYWDRRAISYLEEFKPKVTQEIINNFRNKEVKTVIDIGCGPAHYAIRIAKCLDCNITCLDFSNRMIENAKKNVISSSLSSKFKFTKGNITDLHLPKDYFDGAMVVSLLHHLLAIDIRKVCEKIYDSLKNNGRIIIVEYWTKNKLNKFEKRILDLAEKNKRQTGLKSSILKEKDYLNLLKEVGFSDIRKKYVKDRIFINKYLRKVKNDNSSIDVVVFVADKIKVRRFKN